MQINRVLSRFIAMNYDFVTRLGSRSGRLSLINRVLSRFIDMNYDFVTRPGSRSQIAGGALYEQLVGLRAHKKRP